MFGKSVNIVRDWLEDSLSAIEKSGHIVFCALREDGYKINHKDPAEAFRLDIANIQRSDALLALLDTTISSGVQTEVGVAVALKKKVYLAHLPDNDLSYFNTAMLKAGVVQELSLPLNTKKLQQVLV